MWQFADGGTLLRLQEWRSVWVAYEFDHDAGTHRRRLQGRARPDAEISGYASVERIVGGGPTFFALYLAGGRVFLAAGRHRWDLSRRDLAFTFHTQVGHAISHFRVTEGAEEVFVCSYRHRLRSMRRWFDPALDDLDDVHDHVLLFVAGTALSQDWQADVQKTWSDGHHGRVQRQ